jgi:hypothetical protein
MRSITCSSSFLETGQAALGLIDLAAKLDRALAQSFRQSSSSHPSQSVAPTWALTSLRSARCASRLARQSAPGRVHGDGSIDE